MAPTSTVWGTLLNVKRASFSKPDILKTEDGERFLCLHATVHKRYRCLCPHCGKSCPCYEENRDLRTWRAPDFNGMKVFIRASAPRVSCPEHGVVVAAVPWAYHGSGFTAAFDRTAAWLATHLPRSTVSELLLIDWKTVGRCISRTLEDLEPDPSRRLDGLVRIGVDETSYRKGYKYITVVVNHDTNTVVWAHEGYGRSVFEKFLQMLTPEQRSSIKAVSGDGAKWIDQCMAEYLPNAERCVDPFHVVQWAGDALNNIRRKTWQELRSIARDLQRQLEALRRAEDEASSAGAIEKLQTCIKTNAALAKAVKGALYPLGKNPDNLTERQAATLQFIADTDPRLYRAYQAKEWLRAIIKLPAADAVGELKRWYFKATHSRISELVDLARKVRRHEAGILQALGLKLNNARVEATNNKIKLIIRKAYGFREVKNLIDMVMLVCSNLRIPLEHREDRDDKKRSGHLKRYFPKATHNYA